MNDVLELQTVELLVHKILDENGFHPGSIQIDHLEKRVEQLEKENLQIITTDPYLYKNLLSDAEASAQKEKELEEEYDLYAAYSKSWATF